MHFILAHIIKIILLIWVLYVPTQELFSQRISKNNYTGDWEVPTSWTPTWTVPQTSISGYNITIYGYITVNSSLTFSGAPTNLTIHDTLVVKGNLTLGDFNDITVNNNGILIIRGNLTIHDRSTIRADGYLIVTGDILKTGTRTRGSFKSNDNPVKVFIGGKVSPVLNNLKDYPVLNCKKPRTKPYPNSGCSYGNMTDIVNDPIFSFFQFTCTHASATSNSPVCAGNSINLNSLGGISYSWKGPNDFSSTEKNPSISDADISMTGNYTVTVTAAIGCKVEVSTDVNILPLPLLHITNPAAVYSPATVDLTAPEVTAGSEEGLIFSYWTNAEGTIAFQTPEAATVGTYYIKGATEAGCYDIKPVTATVYLPPTPTLVINNPKAVCSPATVDLTAPEVTAGSTRGLTFTYWTDEKGTIPYPTPATATAGIRYIKGTTALGYYDIKPVIVVVNPTPVVVITNPAALCSPFKADLTAAAVTAGSTSGLVFTYWTDAEGTIPYPTPATATSGTWYIKGTTTAGCYDIKPVSVTIHPNPTLKITNPATLCSPETADLTAAAVTTGSTAGLVFTYWTNAEGTIPYPTPATATPGTWYIKGTTKAGCFDIKPVIVTAQANLTLIITNPAALCSPFKADLTAAAVTAGSTAGLTFTYWTNAEGTIPYTTPATATSGIWYIKGTTKAGCYDIKPVIITINPGPTLVITNPPVVYSPSTVDLTVTEVTAGSTSGLTFTYWTNSDCTIPYPTPAAATSGTWYIKGTSKAGCYDIKPVKVSVNLNPTVVITDPEPVCSPVTVDLTASEITAGSTDGLTYTYWTDTEGSIPYPEPTTATAGTWYIKGTSVSGHYDIKPVTVTVNTFPHVSITSKDTSICMNDQRILKADPAGGTFSVIDGPGSITGNVLLATGIGIITLNYSYPNVCANIASQTILAIESPIPDAGPDQELKFTFETQMEAQLAMYETGKWSFISGSGHIQDNQSPTTNISNLSVGENLFLWTVRNGSCETSTKVKITVLDLIIPSLITPNGDGKNDYFKISVLTGHEELIIFNRLGQIEYSNSNYENNWGGQNNKGGPLPNDTYFYILKFENGLIKKGAVLIFR